MHARWVRLEHGFYTGDCVQSCHFFLCHLLVIRRDRRKAFVYGILASSIVSANDLKREIDGVEYSTGGLILGGRGALA